MHMLELIATPQQREEFLEPMLAGETRSCFSMTEPPPGAGSDPTALRTVAKPDGQGGYIINGEKWLINVGDAESQAKVDTRPTEAAQTAPNRA